jgi:TolB-like protein
LADVFISYTHADRAHAARYAHAFETAGLSVWWDVTVPIGNTFDQETEAALRSAGAVVVLWSPRSVASRWVRSEASVALRSDTLVPVMIELCERPVMFELTQTADMTHWSGENDDPMFQRLLKEVRAMIGHVHPPPEAPPTPVQLATQTEFKLPSKPSIAILPFADLGAAQDHFADGIVEELSTVLSRFSSLFVIAGQSSLSYRGTTKTAQQIARELGVRYLLEGTCRRAGDRVRISVKLVDAPAGEQIWAERFDDRLEDIFELQDRVATAIAGAIDSTMTDAEMRRSVTRPTESLDAYGLTVRANAMLCVYSRESVQEALELAHKAVALDPQFGWAVAIEGFCNGTLAMNRWSDDPAASYQRAMEIAPRAKALAGDDQMALAVTAGLLLMTRPSPRDAVPLMERALALNPEKPFILFWGGVVDWEAGQYERGLERLEKSIRLDPRSAYRPYQLVHMGNLLYVLGRLEEAIVVHHEAGRLLPHFPPPHLLSMVALARVGRVEEARETLRHLNSMGGPKAHLHHYRNPEIRAAILETAAALAPAPAASGAAA